VESLIATTSDRGEVVVEEGEAEGEVVNTESRADIQDEDQTIHTLRIK